MERVLVVEDNKALAKMLSLKIESTLPFEVDIAYSMQEAQLFIRKFKYFMALLDINLPDAPNGEVVDAMLSKDVNCIVLSGNMDKAFRHEMLKKEIIDYVGKGGIEDVDFVIATMERLYKNRNHTVMLVDDSMVFRKQMKRMLEQLFFKVIACAHGEEAINLLQERSDISLVITDYAMPVMDGLELTKEIRKLYKKEQLSVLAISGNSDADVSAMFLKKGATDFIKKPFSKEEFSCRINNTIEALENIEALTNSAKRDILTGLYSRKYLFSEMELYIQKERDEQLKFALAVVSLDDYKSISQTYGAQSADNAIVHLSEILRSGVDANDLVARLEGEEFAIVLKDVTRDKAETILERIRSAVETRALRLNDEQTFMSSLSIGFTCNFDDGFDEMASEADMMLYRAKSEGGNRVVGD